MKKSVLLSFVLLAGLSVAALSSSCRQAQPTDQQTDQETGTGMGVEAEMVQYTCPMHPDVISDEPGTCPECGMDLVLVSEAGSDMEMEADSIMM